MGTRTGDLVWAHVHGYPWWPGQVIPQATYKAPDDLEAYAKLVCVAQGFKPCWLPAHPPTMCWHPVQVMDPSNATDKARKKQEAGKVLISFFGDNSFGWFAQIELLPFSAAYAEKKQQTPQTKVRH